MNTNSKFAQTLNVGSSNYEYFPINEIEGADKLPYSLKILLENVLRCAKAPDSASKQAKRIVDAAKAGQAGEEIEFCPARVLFQDFTGVPVFVDFALMREACKNLGANPEKINPQIPCNLVIDHSVIADVAGCAGALDENMQKEFARNGERYKFLKWAQKSFDNVSIVPPGAGICHQLNIEAFANVVMESGVCDKAGSSDTEAPAAQQNASTQVYFDTLVGTDSHTPTANGIGVLGWGVGGIEAEAASLGQPITILVPKVIGIHLTGKLSAGVSAMDVSLTFAEMLRARGVVGCIVECFGEGLESLSATQRTCISNMTPEYGATATLFPVDEKTINFMHMTGASEQKTQLVEAYAKAQGFWHNADNWQSRNYSEVIELDLGSIEKSIAGPARPHSRINLNAAQSEFKQICTSRNLDMQKTVDVEIEGEVHKLTHGALAIAAVTSCTTATDPAMMLTAGLLAKNAAEAGLKPKPWVKCIFAPGSHATSKLLERAGLQSGMEALGFYTCGFGCMSCIGNSGDILPAMHNVAAEIELASVLSGNRNFEGRISPDVSQNYLASPATVIAYALAGSMDVDLCDAVLGTSNSGKPIKLSDIWPTDAQVNELLHEYVTHELYAESVANIHKGTPAWQKLESSESATFAWDANSTYVRHAPYFDGMQKACEPAKPIKGARVLALLGDFITTDHISPAGTIAPNSPAAKYLSEAGVTRENFNTYGARRGNHEVMARGTFANVKLQNLLCPEKRGGWTLNTATGNVEAIFDASQHYAQTNTPLIVIAGKMYGSGSSRDWAAKGPALLGVRAVIAQSFERIHRSNLIGMGILPLQFEEGQSASSLGLCGTETFNIENIDYTAGFSENTYINVTAKKPDGGEVKFKALVRIDTETEAKYFENGGILQYVLRQLAK